jgi:hypothetical protein
VETITGSIARCGPGLSPFLDHHEGALPDDKPVRREMAKVTRHNAPAALHLRHIKRLMKPSAATAPSRTLAGRVDPSTDDDCCNDQHVLRPNPTAWRHRALE